MHGSTQPYKRRELESLLANSLLQGAKYSSTTTTLALLSTQNTSHGRTTAAWEVNAGAQAGRSDSWQPDNGHDVMITRLWSRWSERSEGEEGIRIKEERHEIGGVPSGPLPSW